MLLVAGMGRKGKEGVSRLVRIGNGVVFYFNFAGLYDMHDVLEVCDCVCRWSSKTLSTKCLG